MIDLSVDCFLAWGDEVGNAEVGNVEGTVAVGGAVNVDVGVGVV